MKKEHIEEAPEPARLDYRAMELSKDISLDLDGMHDVFGRLDQKIMRHCRNMSIIAFFTLSAVVVALVIGLPKISVSTMANHPMIIPAFSAFVIASYLFTFMGLFRLFIWRSTKTILSTLSEAKDWFEQRQEEAFDVLELTSEREKISSISRSEIDTLPILSSCQSCSEVVRHFHFAKHNFLTRIRRRAARSGSIFLLFLTSVVALSLLALESFGQSNFSLQESFQSLARAGDTITALAALALIVGALGYMICEKLFVALGYGYAEERLAKCTEVAQRLEDGVYASVIRTCGLVQAIVHKIAEPVEPEFSFKDKNRGVPGEFSANKKRDRAESANPSTSGLDRLLATSKDDLPSDDWQGIDDK